MTSNEENKCWCGCKLLDLGASGLYCTRHGYGWRIKNKQITIHSHQIKKVNMGSCFICGKFTKLTRHHVIPRAYLKDYGEVIIMMVCRKCHDLIHKKFRNEDLKNLNAKEQKKIIKVML